MHTWATFFFITNPINTNLIHFIPVLNFISHTGCYCVRIGPSRTFVVSLIKISLFRIALSLFRSLALPPIRSFASPIRSFVSPFIVLLSLFRLLIVSQSRSFVVSQFRCFAHSLFRNLAPSLFRNFVVSHFSCFYCHYFVLILFRSFVVSYFRCFKL